MHSLRLRTFLSAIQCNEHNAMTIDFLSITLSSIIFVDQIIPFTLYVCLEFGKNFGYIFVSAFCDWIERNGTIKRTFLYCLSI